MDDRPPGRQPWLPWRPAQPGRSLVPGAAAQPGSAGEGGRFDEENSGPRADRRGGGRAAVRPGRRRLGEGVRVPGDGRAVRLRDRDRPAGGRSPGAQRLDRLQAEPAAVPHPLSHLPAAGPADDPPGRAAQPAHPHRHARRRQRHRPAHRRPWPTTTCGTRCARSLLKHFSAREVVDLGFYVLAQQRFFPETDEGWAAPQADHRRRRAGGGGRGAGGGRGLRRGGVAAARGPSPACSTGGCGWAGTPASASSVFAFAPSCGPASPSTCPQLELAVGLSQRIRPGPLDSSPSRGAGDPRGLDQPVRAPERAGTPSSRGPSATC